MAPEDLLALQRKAGNRATAVAVQRAGERSVAAPDEAWWLGKLVSAQRLKSDLLQRLKKGPLFSDDEVRVIKEQRRGWLESAGVGTYDDAATYARNGKYHDWLQLPPGRRLLIATLEFRERVREGRQDSPAYTLGRTLTANAQPAEERAPLHAERDEQIRNAFVDTLHPQEPSGEGATAEQQKQAHAQQLLTRVFLILQNGLKIRPAPGAEHIDYREGDVARALAHGGRVNIRIPPLSQDGPGRYELAEWLEIADAQGELPEHVTERTYASHHMSISDDRGGSEGAFKERGGWPATVRNLLPRLKQHQVLVRGLDAGIGGKGNLDCNGDLIMPNGAHGHLLLIYTPPRSTRAGSLEVGLETLAPGNHDSPVGHVHNWRSTESTANPESSVHGHKQDKIGAGKLRDNQRYVNLAEFPQPWPDFLRKVESDYNARISAAQTEDELRELVAGLVGRRGEGRFPRP
ncbi:hypothetical protein REH65_30230 [Saccharopolyspora sp. ID03-671]|uniref:hypothetical protein n=1 Tax=Saccharopolyspora sp. ID03-671 TaxID=3073066 RepID=UPI0032536C66